MVLLVELEDNSIANLRSDVGWAEGEDAWTTDDDSMFSASTSDGRIRDCRCRSCGCRRRNSRRDCSGGRCCWRGSAAGCSSQELVKLAIWVDGKDHSLLTVVALSAVDPERLVALDCELCKREIWICHGVGDGNAERIVKIRWFDP